MPRAAGRHRGHGRGTASFCSGLGYHRPNRSRDVMRPRRAKYVTLVTGCVARPAAPRTHRTPGSAVAVVRASLAPCNASRPRKRSRTTPASPSPNPSGSSRRPQVTARPRHSRSRPLASYRWRHLTHRADRRSGRGVSGTGVPRKSRARPPTPHPASTRTRRSPAHPMARRSTPRRELARQRSMIPHCPCPSWRDGHGASSSWCC